VHYAVTLCTRSSFLACLLCVEFVLGATERHDGVKTKIVVLNVSTSIDRGDCVHEYVSYYKGAIYEEICWQKGLWGQWSGRSLLGIMAHDSDS